jgi:hypothetical protein
VVNVFERAKCEEFPVIGCPIRKTGGIDGAEDAVMVFDV